MLPPVLVTPPASLPVALADAKLHLRVDHDDDDTLITSLIEAATQHLDGWSGVLGRAIVTQTWRQDFARFDPCGLRLPLGPVASVTSVAYIDPASVNQVLAPDRYQHFVDARGSLIVPMHGVCWPATACRANAVSVTFVAGVAETAVPAPIRSAILLLVGHLYANREAVTATALAALPMAVDMLITPLRRVGV